MSHKGQQKILKFENSSPMAKGTLGLLIYLYPVNKIKYTRLSQFLTPQLLTILTILNTFFQNGQFSEVAQEAGKYYFMFTIERWGFEYPLGAGK